VITSDLAAHARTLLEHNRYLTLGTADADGRPWLSPVFFVAAGEREYLWASETDARHSRNLVERPQVSIVVFDSTVLPYHGRAVYATAQAREVADDDLDRVLKIYPGPRGGVALDRT
jgi:nitroimidazol reductase NimA-like FMN-containing flavoprotein (pyridoxamine 5'-phosphate oxidase superfamily)